VKARSPFFRGAGFVLVGFAGVLAYYLSYAHSLPFNFGDEGYLLVIASAIAHGSRLYHDIEIYSYMPGLFYFFSLFVGSPAETLAASRTVMAVMLAVNVCLLYWVSRVHGSRVAAIAVALVLCVAPGPWYKAYQPTMWLLLLGCAQRYYITRRSAWLAAMAACAALGVYFRIEVMAAGGAMIVLVLLMNRMSHGERRERLIRHAGIALLMFGGTLLPLLALLAADGILADFVQQVLELPRRFGSRLGAAYRLPPPAFPGFELPSRSSADAWLYWSSFLIPALLLGRTALLAVRSRKSVALRHDFALAVILLAWLALNLPQYAWERPDSTHLAERLFALLAPVPLLVAWGLRAAQASSRWAAKALAYAPAAVFLAYFSGYVAAHIGRADAGVFGAAAQHAILANGLALELAQPIQPVIDRVIKDTAPDETIAALPYIPGFHFVTARPFPTRQLYLFPFNTGTTVELSYICALEKRRTRYVLYIEGFGLDGTRRTALPAYAPRVHAYLRSYFATDLSVAGWTLLRRTGHAPVGACTQ
jgi:hypothetical protein